MRSRKGLSWIVPGCCQSQKTETRFEVRPREFIDEKSDAPPSSAYFVASSATPTGTLAEAAAAKPAQASAQASVTASLYMERPLARLRSTFTTALSAGSDLHMSEDGVQEPAGAE